MNLALDLVNNSAQNIWHILIIFAQIWICYHQNKLASLEATQVQNSVRYRATSIAKRHIIKIDDFLEASFTVSQEQF